MVRPQVQEVVLEKQWCPRDCHPESDDRTWTGRHLAVSHTCSYSVWIVKPPPAFARTGLADKRTSVVRSVAMSRRKQARPIKHLEEDGATARGDTIKTSTAAVTARSSHGKSTHTVHVTWCGPRQWLGAAVRGRGTSVREGLADRGPRLATSRSVARHREPLTDGLSHLVVLRYLSANWA